MLLIKITLFISIIIFFSCKVLNIENFSNFNYNNNIKKIINSNKLINKINPYNFNSLIKYQYSKFNNHGFILHSKNFNGWYTPVKKPFKKNKYNLLK